MHKIIKEVVLSNLFNINTGRYRPIIERKIKNYYPNICEYIMNIYKDSSSFIESIYALKNGLIELPKCPICGNKRKFSNKVYLASCGNKLHSLEIGKQHNIETCLKRYGCTNGGGSKQAQEKIKKTCLEKYGVTNAGGIPEVQKRIRETTMKHYGVPCNMLLDSFKEQRKETWLKKYGTDCPSKSKEVQDKIKRTCLERYGVENGGGSKQALEKIRHTVKEKYGVNCVFQSNEVKEKIKKTCLNKYGVENPFKSEKIKEKIYSTQRKNKSFAKSKPEDECYKILVEIYGINDIRRQYRDKRYSYIKEGKVIKFNCDFYIKSIDTFIEFNGYPAHGEHPYNPNNKEDKKLVKEWKLKYENGKHPLYKKFIYGWTVRDVMKRNIAKENNLNYYEVWTIEEFKKMIDKLK